MKKFLTTQMLGVVALCASMQMASIVPYVAVPVATVAIGSMAGCKLSQAQVLNLADTLDTSLANLAAGINDQALAAKITAAKATLDAVITNWNGKTVTSAIISALNDVTAVMDLIPAAAPYAALANIVIAGVEAIIDLFPSTPVTSSAKAMAKVRISQNAVKVKSVTDYKTKWNTYTQAHPELNVKPI